MPISELLKLLKQENLSEFYPVTTSIIEEAWNHDIDVYQVLPGKSFLLLKKDGVSKWYYAGRSTADNRVLTSLTRNKDLTKEFLALLDIPVPAGRVVSKERELLKAAKVLGYPLVVKPLTGQEGLAVIVNIQTKSLLRKAYRIAKHYDDNIMVEKHHKGNYYRVLTIDHKYFATALARGAEITGDGKHTISTLVKIENRNPQRKKNGKLKKIRLNKKARRLLLGQDMTFKSIPAKGQIAVLSFSGADGGEWIDKTDEIHPINKTMFDKVAQNLDIGSTGIDFISPDISVPYNENNGAIIEVNSAPDIDIHQHPTSGRPRNAARAIVEMLFK